RYSLAPASPLRPSAYLRGSAAVAGPQEQELAVGLSVRPVRALPLRLAVEGRLGESGGSAHVRPAAYAVTEVPPIAIASETRLEVYAQAGYVAGDFATAFVDGQARLERALMRSGGGAEVTAGAGVWGGAQEGSSRLDVGPSAAVSFRLGQARAAGGRLPVPRSRRGRARQRPCAHAFCGFLSRATSIRAVLGLGQGMDVYLPIANLAV